MIVKGIGKIEVAFGEVGWRMTAAVGREARGTNDE